MSADYSRITTAVQSFRDKYLALPGDMTNATKFWGAAHATPATCRTTASATTATCDGNGDGQVIDNGLTSQESYRFWQQLANAGLMEGSYDGITHGASSYSSTAANSPRGKISNSLWFVWNWTTVSGNSSFFDGPYNNSLQFGGISTDGDPYTPIFKPEEAWNLDTKLDDGKPASGNIVMRSAAGLSACTTATATNQLTADYLLSSTNIACNLVFRNQF